MTTLRKLQSLTGGCYDAALGRVSWNLVIKDIASALGVSHATLLQQRSPDEDAHVLAWTGFDAATIGSYETYYKKHNVLLAALNQPSHAHLRRYGVVRTSEMLYPEPLFRRTEYYNDFLKPISTQQLMSTTLSERDAIQLTLFREKVDQTSTLRHMNEMAYLAPHLSRALQVYERLQEADNYRSTFEEYLNRISRGAVLLDVTASIRYANRAMRSILAARDGLIATNNILAAIERTSAKKLIDAIASATTGGSGGRLAVPRPSGAAAYHVLVSPLRGTATRGSTGVLVIVSDPLSPAGVDRTLVQQIYRLTPTECEVACQLADGHSVEAIAARLSIGNGTVRIHLKRVFQKTDTHRQSDLVRLLLLGRTLP